MKHVFVLSPNNSGSTLLHNLLATSSNVAHLNFEEGQDVGWVGPHPVDFGTTRIFTESELELSESFRYNWSKIKKSWNDTWFRNNPDATIRSEERRVGMEFRRVLFRSNHSNFHRKRIGIVRIFQIQLVQN